MKRLSWHSILQRVERRRIVGLWYGIEDGYLRLELERTQLIEEVDQSALPNRTRIAKLLSDAGILSTMDEDGQDEPQPPKTRTN